MTQIETAPRVFGTAMKSFHWAIAVLVLLMLYGGFTLSRETATWHFGTGLVILVLMVIWLGFKGRAARPPLPADMPRWQQITAKATHHSLYLFVTLQPLFGLLLVTTSKGEPTAFNLIPLKIAQNDTLHSAGEVLHVGNAFLICGLVSLHILAAVYHHAVRRDNVLTRMLPFGKV